MRLTVPLCRNYFKRYIDRALYEGRVRSQWHPLTGFKEIKKRKFVYTEHRPWEDQFHQENPLGKRPKRVLVQPLKDWHIFKGDRVEILVGRDKGKQGIINSIIKERNWVYVEGLNCDYSVASQHPDMVPICQMRERPLLVTTQVRLVDPSDNQPTEVEWRYTEAGDKVRVAVHTGRIIPLPSGARELEDFVNPDNYNESDKDTTEKELTQVTFKPQLVTFDQEILESLSLTDDRKRAKTYWY